MNDFRIWYFALAAILTITLGVMLLVYGTRTWSGYPAFVRMFAMGYLLFYLLAWVLGEPGFRLYTFDLTCWLLASVDVIFLATLACGLVWAPVSAYTSAKDDDARVYTNEDDCGYDHGEAYHASGGQKALSYQSTTRAMWVNQGSELRHRSMGTEATSRPFGKPGGGGGGGGSYQVESPEDKFRMDEDGNPAEDGPPAGDKTDIYGPGEIDPFAGMSNKLSLTTSSSGQVV